MRPLVIFGGRFQPLHCGHKAAYDHLCRKFGDESVFVASADKQTSATDPFTWKEKKQLATLVGIPADKFICVRSVYSSDSIRDVIPYDPNSTVLVLALSEKDSNRLVGDEVDDAGYALKKDGTRARIQWLRSNPTPVAAGFTYVYKVPTFEFKAAENTVMSASEIRELYVNSSSNARVQLLRDLYGDTFIPKLYKLFNKRILTDKLLREFIEFVNKC